MKIKDDEGIFDHINLGDPVREPQEPYDGKLSKFCLL